MEKASEKIQITSFDTSTLWPTLKEWLFGHILTANTLFQIIFFTIALSFAWFLFRMSRHALKVKIDNSKLPHRGKRVLHNLAKLLFPLLTLIIMFFMTHIAASDMVKMDVWLIEGIKKALMAWIVIRTFAQFIDNSLIRNIFSQVVWIMAALSIFGVLEDTAELLDQIAITFGTFKLSLLAIFKGLFLIMILIYTASGLSSLAEQRIKNTRGLTPTSRVLISKIIRFVLVIIAILVGLTNAGIDLSLFAVFGGAIGLGIGFGLQKGVANLFSGMMLLLDKSIKPGDIIELENGAYGFVHQMAARYTEVVTMDRKSYLIPNEELITQRVINWSHNDTLIMVSVRFGVHYDSNPHDVIKFALNAARTIKRILIEPAPTCHMTDFGDSSINFQMYFWIEDPINGMANVKSEVLLALWDAFKENGIQIPYPHREVFVHKIDN